MREEEFRRKMVRIQSRAQQSNRQADRVERTLAFILKVVFQAFLTFAVCAVLIVAGLAVAAGLHEAVSWLLGVFR